MKPDKIKYSTDIQKFLPENWVGLSTGDEVSLTDGHTTITMRDGVTIAERDGRVVGRHDLTRMGDMDWGRFLEQTGSVDNEQYCHGCGRRHSAVSMAESGICKRCARIDEGRR